MQMLLCLLSRVCGRIHHPTGWVRILVARDGKELGAQIHVWPPCKLSAWFSLSSFCWHVCLFMTIPNFGIKLTLYHFRMLSSIGLTGSLSGDFVMLSELKTLYVFYAHFAIVIQVLRFNFQLISLNHHSTTRNCTAQKYKNSLLNVCGSYGEYY